MFVPVCALGLGFFILDRLTFTGKIRATKRTPELVGLLNTLAVCSRV